MTYSYQTVSSGQVLTAAIYQQTEDNIRDHFHGRAGVGVVGLGYNVSSKGGSFSVAAADHGTLFLAGGDFDISMAAAGSLGATFGCGIKNIGSGRLAIKPNGSQLIDATSYFVLTPGEMVNIYSDGIGLGTFGSSFGPKLLWDTGPITSLVNIDVLSCYPNDFAYYELVAQQLVVNANNQVRIQVSVDSGSSFLSASYADEVTADTTFHRWSSVNVGSTQFMYGSVLFSNNAMTSINGNAVRYSSGENSGPGGTSRVNKWPVTTVVNAIRTYIASGNFTGGRIQLWGFPRR